MSRGSAAAFGVGIIGVLLAILAGLRCFLEAF